MGVSCAASRHQALSGDTRAVTGANRVLRRDWLWVTPKQADAIRSVEPATHMALLRCLDAGLCGAAHPVPGDARCR